MNGVWKLSVVVALSCASATSDAALLDDVRHGAPVCPVDANQVTTSRGVAGQSNFTISQDGSVIWEGTITRASASSGTRASGIEFRNLRYRGQLVLGRASTPIVTSNYPSAGCGPFRYWQYEEGTYQTPPACSALGPGIQFCPSAPTTIIETGSDTGNFRGVTIYSSGNGTVFMTELEAGWERHVMKWTLKRDGSIAARVGFAATPNGCACVQRMRHAYFRIDPDLGTAEGNRIRRVVGNVLSEYGTETAELRTGQRWHIDNPLTGLAYGLVPGANDGSADTFGGGDVWILRNHAPPELDDGINVTSGAGTAIDMSALANNETIGPPGDVVVWYGVHHDELTSPEYLGPDFVSDGVLFSNSFE